MSVTDAEILYALLRGVTLYDDGNAFVGQRVVRVHGVQKPLVGTVVCIHPNYVWAGERIQVRWEPPDDPLSVYVSEEGFPARTIQASRIVAVDVRE